MTITITQEKIVAMGMFFCVIMSVLVAVFEESGIIMDSEGLYGLIGLLLIALDIWGGILLWRVKK